MELSKADMAIVLLVVVAICFVVFTAPKYVEHKGLRIPYNYECHKNLAPIFDWAVVAKRVTSVLLIGIGAMLLLHVKEKLSGVFT